MTARDFRLPDLGEGLQDAEIVRWLVAEGDPIAVDQAVVEVVTAKASVELPSPFGGVVAALHHVPGDVVAVGAPLLSIEESDGADERPDVTGAAGERPGAVDERPGAADERPGAADERPGAADERPERGEVGSGSVLVGYGTRPERRRRRRPAVLSPVVRRLASEAGVDLSAISGSGPDGVITRRDVERAAASQTSAGGNAERIPITGLRRQMAEHLAMSRREIPEATVWVDVDATGLLEAKQAIDGNRGGRQAGLGLTSFMARFCVLGLERWPLLNSRIVGDEIVLSRSVNLGFAAQTDRGLVVPVVQHADQLNLEELDDEIRRLTTAARDGRLTPAELTGGSFTLNNYGVFGVDGSAAIINYPEVAIVGVGRIIERPWVVGGEVRIRPVAELTLAFDHRVCDGGVAGGFLRFVADCVERPVRLLAL
jgi:2-oxoisovalerate dehydrogenase E2 component (dihydrolipoyl transacylase)